MNKLDEIINMYGDTPTNFVLNSNECEVVDVRDLEYLRPYVELAEIIYNNQDTIKIQDREAKLIVPLINQIKEQSK